MFSDRRAGARLVALAAAVSAAVLLAACSAGDAGSTATSDCPAERVNVVVSVGQWGDIVSDLAGGCAKVTTIITGASVDPHAYEPTPGDLAAIAKADLVVINGVGYDAWAQKAAEARSPKPAVVDAGHVVDASSGDNPHLWYAPAFVHAVGAAITSELTALSPRAGTYFEQRAAGWRSGMQSYDDEVAHVRGLLGGSVTYAATEPVFDLMAQAIGLVDKTPSGYARSASNDVDPSPGDLHEFERALSDGSVDLLIVNTQTSSAVTDRLRSLARSADVPVVDVTESPPRSSTFVSWQVGQLESIARAVGR